MNANITDKVAEYVEQLISTRSPEHNYYHSLNHTKEVVAATIEIAKAENLQDDDLEVVVIAAWFHDTGYVEKTSGHEEISGMFASGFLASNNYPADKIEKVVGCILATHVPQRPKNHLQKIICDADLHHLGRTTFEQRNNLFRKEFEFYYGRKLTESEWLIKTIEFLSSHNFFTDYAQENYVSIRDENLKLLHNQLNKLKESSSTV